MYRRHYFLYDHNDPRVAIQNRDAIEAAFGSLPTIKKGRIIKKHAVFQIRRKNGTMEAKTNWQS